MNGDDLAREYRARYENHLTRIAVELSKLVDRHLTDVSNIDRVIARAKDPDRFVQKALRLENGTPKYKAPLIEIQDQIGVRVIVYYLPTVDDVLDVILRYFRPIEQRALVPESDWEFGYFGRHAVLALPPDVVPSDVSMDAPPPFFELQVKTLFQHAWSEAEHDLGYKAPTPLTSDQQRRMAFAAAQAWGADRAFHELYVELSPLRSTPGSQVPEPRA